MASDDLPGYTSQPSAPGTGPSEGVYSLERNKGQKWLLLRVRSRTTSPTSLPIFFEKDVISGTVELDLVKPENLKAVTISVRAGITTVGQEEERFLDIRQDLWASATSGSSKLTGQHSWSFSITLPGTVIVKTTSGKGIYRLPPNFSERASPVYINYRLQVNVRRGVLKVDQTLTTSFGYLPISYPSPPSPLRQLAYREGSGLIGPLGDPDGWQVLPPVSIKGTLFSVREAEIECILAIAKPLCCAVGSTLPVQVTLASKDRQALDLLTNEPNAIRLHLVRSMATGSDAIEEDATRRSNNFFLESVGQAFFWPNSEGAPQEDRRVFQGEIDIRKSLVPTFVFPRFAVRYTVDLLAFDVQGFTPTTTEGEERLISERVAIVTRQVPGMQTRSYAPPGYEKPQGGDYNKSMGLLENGNQRFIHHGR